MIFVAMCYTWVILRKIVIHLYRKRPHHLNQLFHFQILPIWCHYIECKLVFILFFTPKYLLMTSYPKTLTLKTLIKRCLLLLRGGGGGGGGGALSALVPSCVGHVRRPPINYCIWIVIVVHMFAYHHVITQITVSHFVSNIIFASI
jgi:hypothetical protein